MIEMQQEVGKLPNKMGKKGDADEKIRRSSKACDNCRKAKCKCTPVKTADDGSMLGPCSYCQSTNLECTFTASTRKRGPPKGYLQAVEDRLHRMEALLGGLINNEDPRAQALLDELITDEEMRQLFVQDCKVAADIGAEGKGKHSWANNQQGQADSTTPDSSTGFAPVPGPSNSTNTNNINNTLNSATANSTSNAPPEPKRRFKADAITEMAPNLFHKNFDRKLLPGRTIHTAEDDISELADVYGQLSLNEWQEVRYHGRTSGLYLIANSEHFKDFFWRLPNNGVWPYQPVPHPFDDHHHHQQQPTSELDRIIIREARACLPDRHTQEQLLDAYFAYVHPFFPVIYKPWFTSMYAKTDTATCGLVASKDEVPVFLLLTMFSIAARYCDPTPGGSGSGSGPAGPQKVKGQHWPAGDEYVKAAKMLMSLPQWGSSRLTSIQGLLLLSYREIGIGAMANAWFSCGSAVRMAQDTGLFREVERWIMPAGSKFSHEEKQTRKRTWWACVIMDRFISAYVGRPQAIFERDFDTLHPNVDEPDEHEQWVPPNAHNASSNVKAASLSCFKELSELCSLVGHVIAHIYAIRVRVLGQSSEALLQHLDQQLANWYIGLPKHLCYAPGDSNIPPPHVLALHCFFFTALILLHRPFIPINQSTDDPKLRPSLPSHAIATTAANSITRIVSAYEEHYGLAQPIPFLVYFVFSAAVMHIHNVTRSPPDAILARQNLNTCIRLLDELSVVWNSAGRQRDLLAGLVNLAEPVMANSASPDSSHGQKRTAASAGILPEDLHTNHQGMAQGPPYTNPEPFQFGQNGGGLFGQAGFDFAAPSLTDLHGSTPFSNLFNFLSSNGGTSLMQPSGGLFGQTDAAYSHGMSPPSVSGSTHAGSSPQPMADFSWMNPAPPMHQHGYPHFQMPSYNQQPQQQHDHFPCMPFSQPGMAVNAGAPFPGPLVPPPPPPLPSSNQANSKSESQTSDLFLSA